MADNRTGTKRRGSCDRASARPAEPALVLDWDGTVTERDTLHMVIEEFGDLGVFAALEPEVGGRMTLDAVISLEMATITAPLDEVVDWLLASVRVRPGFHELVERHDPLIVSAGFHEIIAPILRRERVAARVVANHVVPDSAGWRSEFPDGPLCEVCGERCKRSAVAGLGAFAYAGDGVSDRCVSLAAARRFARAGLATWLDEQGVAYEPFVDLRDVARALEEAGDGRGG